MSETKQTSFRQLNKATIQTRRWASANRAITNFNLQNLLGRFAMSETNSISKTSVFDSTFVQVIAREDFITFMHK